MSPMIISVIDQALISTGGKTRKKKQKKQKTVVYVNYVYVAQLLMHFVNGLQIVMGAGSLTQMGLRQTYKHISVV